MIFRGPRIDLPHSIFLKRSERNGFHKIPADRFRTEILSTLCQASVSRYNLFLKHLDPIQ